MKASEIDKGLWIKDPWNPDDDEIGYYIPPSQIPVYKAYQKVGQQYERSVHDRVWDWWLSLVTSDPVSKQDIQIRIPQLYRKMDPATGKEFLFYNKEMYGLDWKGNKKSWDTLEGVTDGMPEFSYEIDPTTNKVIAGTTQVLEVTRKYTIPFSKEAVEKIKPYFTSPLSCIIIDPTSGRKYSCSLQEFKDMPYEELINLKNGWTEYMNSRQRGQLKEGGVK
jgi:hypothetical protein